MPVEILIFSGHHRLNLVNSSQPTSSKPSNSLINAQWILKGVKSPWLSQTPTLNYTRIETHHLAPFLTLLSCYFFHFFCHSKELLRVKPGWGHLAYVKICLCSPELSENWGSSQLAGCSFSTTWIGGGDRHQSMTGGSTSAEHGIRQKSHACSLKHQETLRLPVWLPDYWNKGPHMILGNLILGEGKGTGQGGLCLLEIC